MKVASTCCRESHAAKQNMRLSALVICLCACSVATSSAGDLLC